MKHLKYFESNEDLDLNKYDGLTPELIDDMFVDIVDMGLTVRTNFDKRMVVVSTEGQRLEIATIPYISITIQGREEIKELNESGDMGEIISVCNDRLKDYNWYVSEKIYEENQWGNSGRIKVFLHREMDEKYVPQSIDTSRLKDLLKKYNR